MAPILFALALFAQDAVPAAADGPVSTQTDRKQDVAPLPIQGGPMSPPSDDYGYVGWCYGAVSGYVELYDKAMPEVIRIERAWPTPGTEENIAVVYPQQKKDAMRSLELYRRAIEAAEKASPTPIAPQGAAAIKKGRGVWSGATSVPKAQLAQFWMSWAPPAKCDETAAALEKKATLFGQALTYNADVGAAAAPAPAAAAPAPVAEAPPAEAARAETVDETPPAAPETPPVVEAARAEVAQETPASQAPAATPEPAVETPTGTPADAPSAIEDLLPVAEPADTAATAEAEPATEPEPPAPPPVAAPAAPKPAAAAPAKPKPGPAAPRKKPGLRDTIKGMRGPA